jgi:insertion element IS1 protein InsB
LSRLLERVERWKPRLYCADGWAAYAELIPPGGCSSARRRRTGSSATRPAQRHWLARFRRRSIVVSKTLRMVEASIALFVRFANDRGIGELLSMLA